MGKNFLNQTLGLRKSFLNQTIYVLKNWLQQQSFLSRDSLLNRAFLNQERTVLLKIDMKNCPLLGKLLSVWRTVSALLKSAQTAQSAQTVENSHSFFNVSYT